MLNENQRLAVEHIDGPALVLAGPGSGKTFTLTNRIAHLIEYGISPSSILVITFTRDAALSMKEKFMKISGGITGVTFGTFHSVFFNMLRKKGKYSEYSIVTGEKKYHLIRECLLDMGHHDKNFLSNGQIEKINKLISYYKNTNSINYSMCIESGLIEEEFMLLIKKLDKRLERGKLLDFDDIIIRLYEEFIEDREFLRYWQDRFSYFLIDELQDINGIQFEVVKKLLNNHPCGRQNIFGVGDDDQAIYGFRGSSPSFMLDFPKEFKGTRIIRLDINYRSKRNIVAISSNLVEKNKNRFEKEVKPHDFSEGRVDIISFENEIKQAEFIVKNIKGDTGILFRNKKLALPVIGALRANNLAFFAPGLSNDISKSKVRNDFLSYFHLINGKYKRSNLINILNKPPRQLDTSGLTEEYVDLHRWRDSYPKLSYAYGKIDELMASLRLMKGFSPYLCINFLKKGIGYEDYLKGCVKNNIAGYTDGISVMEAIEAAAMNMTTHGELIEFLSENTDTSDTEGDIKLYTFHASKGLEFDNVFIICANQGISPSQNAIDIANLEEERRMFYVAMTRAKRNLTICTLLNHENERAYPSVFLREMEADDF